MSKERRIEFSSQEALKFHARLEELFLALVLDVQAWTSDSSSILDFIDRSDPRFAMGPGRKPGYFVFKRCKPQRVNLLEEDEWALNEHEWEYEEVEEKGVEHTTEVVRKTKFYFGVDITPVFEKTFPAIFQHISENMTPKRRAALEADGWVGRRYQKYRTDPRRVASVYWPTSPGFLFRVDEYADGHCVIHYKKRQGGGRDEGQRSGRYKRLFDADRFDTSVMRPQLNEWLKAQGALPMNPWGRDDPRNIEKEKEWTTTKNKDGSISVRRKKKCDAES